jgi:hypothetical protein
MSYFEPHKEVLSPEQLTLMPGLIGATRLGYVLYLMANKLKVILQRVSAKNYLDIAAMVNAGIALDKGLAAARLMFGQAFQPAESLRAMTYFEGGDLHLLTDQDRRTLIQAARAVRRLPDVQLLSQALAKGAETRDVEADRPEESNGLRI